jgi:Zn-dependent protease with chaperone function
MKHFMPQHLKPIRANLRKYISLALIALTTAMQTNQVLAETSLSSNAIGRLYSNAELTVQLATKPDVEACHDQICLEKNVQFTQRVLVLGDRLQARAYALDETLKKRIPQFQFSVADKTTVGTISDANGHVVVFRGLQNIALSDAALSFLMAREMAHVVTGHHDKNVATKLLISALASVLFPALAIVSASSAAQQASTATTIATNVASTATSLLGGEVAIKQAKPSQLKESDEWALKLLDDETTDMTMLSEELEQALAQINESSQNGWSKDLMKSVAFLQDKTTELVPRPTVLQAEVE